MFGSKKYAVTEQEYELVEYVMRRMPVRARLLGRPAVADAVAGIVLHWPVDNAETLEADSPETQLLLDSVEARVSGERRSGFLVPILLAAVLSTLIRIVLEWWLSGRDKQWAIKAWQHKARNRT